MNTTTIAYHVEIEDDGNEETTIDLCGVQLYAALETLRENKPNDRSEKDRRFAVTITELEKVYAYYVTFAMDEGEAK